MSTPGLERELARWRGESAPPSDAVPLSIEQALAYRDAGNLPDEHGRTLRLVLFARTIEEVRGLGRKRAEFEPDYHSAPDWRRDRSAPVNVVPLRSQGVAGEANPWWEASDVAELEEEWRRTGRIAGVRVPAEYRGFVLKTVAGLRDAGREIDVESIGASLARWLSPQQTAEITDAIRAASES